MTHSFNNDDDHYIRTTRSKQTSASKSSCQSAVTFPMTSNRSRKTLQLLLLVLSIAAASASADRQGAMAESRSRLLASLPRQGREREGFSISPKSCEVSGLKGTCMFVWECLKTDGQHLGMCMEGFMFGSCCVFDNDKSKPVTTSRPSTVQQEVFQKIQQSVATTTTKQTTTTEKPWSLMKQTADSMATVTGRPTRPARPTKPLVKWPPAKKRKPIVDNKVSNSVETDEEPITNKPYYRPTKKPVRPPPRTPPTWVWSEQNRDKDSEEDETTIKSYYPSNNDQELLADREEPKPFYPISDEDREGDVDRIDSDVNPSDNEGPATEWTSLKVRPTRPTRPPKTKMPSAPTKGFVFQKTTSTTTKTTTASTTTRTTTRTTTTTATTTTTTTTAMRTTVTRPRPRVTTPRPPRRKPSSSSVSSSSAVHRREKSCGIPQIEPTCAKGRIVNGTQSCYGQFPWQVSVRRTSFFGFTSTHRCGGALINEYWIATAGHCVDDLQIPKIRVRIGEWDFSATSEKHPHIELKVTKKIVHPKYNFFTYENDLALIRLEKKVEFRDNIIPICLPGNDDLLIGEKGTVAGWGRLSEGGQLPNILQYVQVPIVSNAKCKEMFLKAGRHEVIPDIFMCAGYDNGGRDSCQGDSGGPLVVKGNDGRWFLGGIISWGIGCAEPNLPGVCTRISKFRNWILANAT